MDIYKQPYFTLFSTICDTIEELEQLLQNSSLSQQEATLLWKQVKKLKKVQQTTEEQIIQTIE